MNIELQNFILKNTRASEVTSTETIQSLWSGYGEMLRVGINDAEEESVVVKDIQLSTKNNHPRGWNSDIGHQRKLISYQVESYWYKNYASQSKSRIPKCLAVEYSTSHIYILLEDLNTAGFPVRKHSLNWNEFSNCLKWLAEFHVSFLGVEPEGLWNTGTYWHLDTRPQELEVLEDLELKKAAEAIDTTLNNCEYKTLVHGDAKLANFCFSELGEVAGVDFQYVGGGCGMKDVAYFAGSCLSENECERLEEKILDTYFQYFNSGFGEVHSELEQEWRSLYRVAWADFHRFLKGWSPGHWKINSYSERITKEVIESL
ncbi:MAG: DUF1679 domain-containing protein [Winogradskyella sp.]|uniref:oxidoreductase family protein n=1 Tax=Winogradskyella sp. TaxID=1883156 RepID=UPI0025FF5548|nr:oxidoreductase family protein [Winogradskyella sp.]NRB61111.1 DUF1679 domain-containing protein [Winogradskyella sp.]